MTTDILCGQIKHHEQQGIRNRNELNSVLFFVQITFRRAPLNHFIRAGRLAIQCTVVSLTVDSYDQFKVQSELPICT